MKQIAAMISARIGSPAPMMPTDGEDEPDGADQAERARGQHEPVGALLALLAGEAGTAAALDVAHLSDYAMDPTRDALRDTPPRRVPDPLLRSLWPTPRAR